jgi:hypothetical protein
MDMVLQDVHKSIKNETDQEAYRKNGSLSIDSQPALHCRWAHIPHHVAAAELSANFYLCTSA